MMDENKQSERPVSEHTPPSEHIPPVEATAPKMHHAASHVAPDAAFKMPKLDMKDFNIGVAFKNMLSILKLDKKAIEEIGHDEKNGPAALIFLLVSSILVNLMPLIFGLQILTVSYRPGVVDTIITIVVGILGLGVALVGTSFAAVKFFKGQGTFAQYFRVMGLAYGINIITIVGYLVAPLLGILALITGVWVLVVYYVAAKVIFKLDTKNTVFTLLVALVITMVWGIVINAIGLNPSSRAMSNSSLSNMTTDGASFSDVEKGN